MKAFYFIRYGSVFFAFTGWILYQLFYKSKQWNDIKNDVYSIVFFLTVACAIFYFLFS